jgi:uncharacterized protein
MNMGFPDGLLALDRLAAGPVEWTGRLSAAASAWDLGEIRLASDPRLRLRAESVGAGVVRVSGLLSVQVEQECRRCLEPVIAQVELELELRFDPELAADEESEGLYALDSQVAELDLGPALREELLLAVPDFPVCAEACRGLCPVCGVNRNEESCDCRTETIDPRWEALRQEFPVRPDAAEGAGDGTSDV